MPIFIFYARKYYTMTVNILGKFNGVFGRKRKNVHFFVFRVLTKWKKCATIVLRNWKGGRKYAKRQYPCVSA